MTSVSKHINEMMRYDVTIHNQGLQSLIRGSEVLKIPCRCMYAHAYVCTYILLRYVLVCSCYSLLPGKSHNTCMNEWRTSSNVTLLVI